MVTTEPNKSLPPLLALPPVGEVHAPGWFRRLPAWVGPCAALIVLLGLSAFIRTRELTGQLWYDEANTVGIASRSLTAIPGILREGGGAPLYFVLLHLWMSAFGATEGAVRALSVLIGLTSIPVAMWAGWSLFGRRAGYMAAALAAFNSFLTTYASEARMYELVAVLAIVCVAAFLHAFVFERRGHRWLFAGTLALMFYAEPWCLLFAVGLAAALLKVASRSENRGRILRDGAVAFGVAVLVFLPWVPTLIHQAENATAPWHYAPLLGANFPRDLFGTDRVDAVFAIAVIVGCVPLLRRERRGGRDATAVLSLITIVAATVLLALFASLFVPAWTIRYLAPVLAPLLLLVTYACARSGIVGIAVVVLSCAFLANAASFVPKDKSDMQDLSGELGPGLHRNDLVLLAQPEQTPLAFYYMPGGLRYATALGPDPHPGYMNWDNAYARLANSNPRAVLDGLVAKLAPGQHLLYIRPLTEGEDAWTSNWAALVRRRAAQWGALLASDPELRAVPGAWAPHSYEGSCCIASSALLFTKR